jgi:uncharacterized protein involved in outer membrane biogenesis
MRRRIVVAAALAGVLSLALWNVDFLVQRNRGFFIDRAERTLGRKISTDQIKVTFWPLGARLENFVLADDPAFSTEDFLRAKALHVELRLLPLFLGQFLAKRMALESPSITVVRDAQGRYNFANRARNEKNDRRGKTLRVDQQDGRLLWAPSFHISDGTLRFRDLTDGGELTATQIHFKVTDFASGDAFEIELEAAVNAAKPNLQLKSWIGSNPENRDFRDVPVAGELNATDLDLGKVNKALPQLRRALPRALRFDGIYTIKQLKFKGTLNHLSLKGAVTGTDASFRFE